MDAKSVMDLLRNQQEESNSGLSKGAWSASTSAAALPKSWFNDPYAMLDSMGLGYRSNPSALSYETLKQMAEKNVIIAAIIQTRLNQVAAFCQPQKNKYSIGFKVAHRNPRHRLTEGEKEYLHKLERFITNMGVDRDVERDSFEVFTRKTIRDRLTYDQVCAEKVLRRNGKPHSIFAVPADTYRLATPRTKRGTPMTKAEAARTPKYIQIIDGAIVNEYRRDELIFRVSNPRTDLRAHGYGLSELELLINTVTSHLWAEEWNRKVFSQGSTVKGILNVTGNIAPAQMESFKRQWMTQVSGVSNAWRTPVMNSDNLQWIPLQPSNNDMGYQQWLEYLIKIACAVYLIDPAEINFDTRGGVGNQPMFMTTNEAQQKVSKDRGLQPLLRFHQNIINEEILWPLDENYEFAFVGLDARTESEAIELRMKELQSYKTLNEIRREADELPPVPEGDTVMNATYVGYLNQKASQAASAGQGGPQGGQPGVPGSQGMPGLPGVPAPDSGAPDAAPGAGGQKEMFENMFGKPNDQKFGQSEQALGGQVEQDMATPGEKDKPNHEEEPHTQDETSDDWENTIHASLGGKRLNALSRHLTDDLSKALNAFGDLR